MESIADERVIRLEASYEFYLQRHCSYKWAKLITVKPTLVLA